MIDAPYRPTDAMKWRHDIADKGEVRYIVNTEYHVDHIAGNYFFPGTVVSHQGIREMFFAPIESVVPFPEGSQWARDASVAGLRNYIIFRFKSLDPEGLPLASNYELRPPTITFTERFNLHLGDHTFELYHLPGHTPYEVGVYIPQERIIFNGDNVTNGSQPSLAQSCPLEWIESLKKIAAMDVDLVVPGHGEVGDKKVIHEMAKFIQECIDKVRKAIDQGMSEEEAANTISFEQALTAIHPGVGQQRSNVIRLYEMLSK